MSLALLHYSSTFRLLFPGDVFKAWLCCTGCLGDEQGCAVKKRSTGKFSYEEPGRLILPSLRFQGIISLWHRNWHREGPKLPPSPHPKEMPRCSEVSLWPHSTLALRVLTSLEAKPVRCSAGPALQKQESSSLASIHGKSAPKRGRRSRWAAARRWPTCAPGQRRGRRGGRGERAGNRPHPALEAAGGSAVVPARQGEKLSDEEMRTLLVIRAGEHDPASRSVPRPGASTCCRKGRRRVRGPANAFHVLKPRKADSGPAAPEVRRGPGLRGSAPGPCCPLASTGSRVPGSPRRGWGAPGGGGGRERGGGVRCPRP